MTRTKNLRHYQLNVDKIRTRKYTCHKVMIFFGSTAKMKTMLPQQPEKKLSNSKHKNAESKNRTKREY